MAFVDSSKLSSLLSQWAAGNLDFIEVGQSVVAGVDGCVVGGGGLRAQTLLERFTSEDINRVLCELSGAGHQGFVVALVCVYLLGWTVDRLGRAMQHPDSSHTYTYLMHAQDTFAGWLLDGQG